ncbi:PD-(D/E)XK nuclease family protein [Candidatus Woesearchaeota archaeon]|nr:PD-(D/E)XK nuclease family protein [Candidatus Woesearchaeota archaeon]
MPKRVQSPSSINIYKQCPRRYYYQYVVKHPTKPNIHTLRGNIVHTALEKFYQVDISALDATNYKPILAKHLRTQFARAWTVSASELSTLGLLPQQLQFYYDESATMLANWLNDFIKRLDKELKLMTLQQAFKKLMPIEIETQYKSQQLMVQGYIDCVHVDGEDIILLDYKTSKNSELKPEYRLQLAIYATLYREKHGKLPSKVGIWFLKDKPVFLDVNEEMVKQALFEIEQIHFSTESTEIIDYPKNITPLCKWNGGQCDFYHVCLKDA